jgi:DNA-directed RNA polymerase specialized sigma24 family protein
MTDPDDSGPASVPSSDAPIPPSGVRVDDEDAPPSSGPVSARDADEGAPPPSGTQTRVIAVILEFIASRKKGEGSDFVIGVVKDRLGKNVAHDMLEDIVQGALVKAVECRWPPWTVAGVPAWLARLTRRQIADYFRKEKGRIEEPKGKSGQPRPEKPEPTARPRSAAARNAEAARLERHGDAENAPRVEPRERTEWIRDRASPPTDERARARLIHDWLAAQIGSDPRKVHTLGLMKEHEVDGFTLGELAERERTTERALANRFHKLRVELAPKVALMDDEKTRRMVFFFLIFGGIGFVIAFAIALWLLFFSPPPVAPAEPALRPAPSASAVPAPPPEFDNANPTEPPLGDASRTEPPGKR